MTGQEPVAASTGSDDGSDALSLAELYDFAPTGYLSLRDDGTVVRVNETLLEWTGLTREAVLAGPGFASLLTIASRIFYETHCVPMLLAGEQLDQISLDVRRADGSSLPVLFGARRRTGEEDTRPAVVRVTLVNISQRRALERNLVAQNERLAQANEEYDTFAHTVAHDLRAPLRGIRTNTEFFLEDTDGQLPAAPRELLETVMRLSDRMQDMLDDLLSHAQAGTQAWDPRPIPLPQAVAEALDLLGPSAIGAHVTWTEKTFRCDPVALRQLLLNLIGNAVKYSSEPATVTIDVETLGSAARRSAVPPTLQCLPTTTEVLTVADRGIGIEDIHREGIFRLFRQLDPSAEGLGAGLALCRLLCRRQNGDVWVSSTPDRGSTFYVVADALSQHADQLPAGATT